MAYGSVATSRSGFRMKRSRPGARHPAAKPGGQRTYADIAIEAALTIRMVFHLPLRQTEGFLRCLAEMLEVDLPVPDHTTLSRRLKRLTALVHGSEL